MDNKKVINTAKEFIEELLLNKLDFEAKVEAQILMEEDREILDIRVEGDDLSLLIGNRGRNLESIQYLLLQVLYKAVGDHVWVKLDINGYREKKQKSIENIALKAAHQSIDFGVETALEPMSPADRRIVHMILAEDERVETDSEGEGYERHVVIRPTSENKLF